jgi:hypothetical protein
LVIGSKENFTFFSIFPLYLIFILSKVEIRGLYENIIGLISIILVTYSIFILCVLGWYFLSTHEEISGYGLNENTLVRIVYKFLKIIFIHWGGILLIPIILFLKFKNKVIQKNDYDQLKQLLTKMFFYLVVVSFLLFFQVVYYTGGLPSGTRYDFPTIILYSSYLIILVFYSKLILPIFIESKHVKFLILLMLLSAFISKNTIPNIFRTASMTSSHVINTENYYSTIEKIKLLSSQSPKQSIIINSFNVWDFELISSFYKFLRANEVENPMYLKLNYDSSNYESNVEKLFVERLVDISQGGGLNSNPDWVPNNNVLQLGYESLDNLEINYSECILININMEVKDNVCKKQLVYVYTGR